MEKAAVKKAEYGIVLKQFNDDLVIIPTPSSSDCYQIIYYSLSFMKVIMLFMINQNENSKEKSGSTSKSSSDSHDDVEQEASS